MDSEFADKVVNECVSHYQSLSKKGKPVRGKEWTLLSSVVMALDNKVTVVAMATGTKCLGRNRMSPKGDVVNDSHAEVLARRCFMRYLYDQISKFQSTGTSDIIIGCNEKNQYEINPDVKFHFYSSHVPCGDASIIPKYGGKRKCENNSNQQMTKRINRQLDVDDKIPCIDTINLEIQNEKFNDECSLVLSDNSWDSENLKSKGFHHTGLEISNKEILINNNENTNDVRSSSSKIFVTDSEEKDLKVGNFVEKNSISREISHVNSCDELEDCVGELVDVHRTGAKCLQGEDRKLPGALYHQVGAVRTKPGRGDPTLSVSCSDKMARWIACGLQGALLSLLLSRPVLLTSVVIGGGGQFSAEALRRALLNRSGSPNRAALLHSSIVFPHSRYLSAPSAQPCPSAILWARVTHKPVEVCVEGRRQGATKNCKNNGRLMICKLELLRSFLAVSKNTVYQGMSYRTVKASAEPYNNTWMQVKHTLNAWTVKPVYLEDFKIDS